MRKTTFSRFEELARSGGIVPVYREVLADMETPVSVLSRFAGEENVFLFESVEAGERFGRYSFIGFAPRGLFRIEDGKAFLDAGGTKKELAFDRIPLDALRSFISREKFAAESELPPLPGGAVGFLAYEACGMFEELPPPKAAAGVPDALFMLTDRIIAFDNLRHTAKLIVCVHTAEYPTLRDAYAEAQRLLDETAGKLASPQPGARHEANSPPQRPVPATTREEFTSMVAKAKKHIEAGDVIQIVLSQRFEADFEAEPLRLYRALRLVNPSPYTFFLKTGGITLIGSSPETLVKLTGTRSCLRPIAGTRRRDADPARDRLLADELLRDEKERAEHLMLVDLGRNDLGRTAVPASVQVKSFMNVERYSHVMHLVSEVEAELADGHDAIDLLRTAFPAGTLSGAPKIRAMELINELEAGPRGIYGGAVGYLGYGGDMDMAITIRTFALQNGSVSIQAGAGIVFDSDPESEYEETLNKAGALFKALEMAADDEIFSGEIKS